ncbi:MAG: helix-turn-helix transcriptional regulator [Rubrivivax sp.]|nr:helix-turn-helix transcriptional regulator [Rubrivivax sp.]
MILTTLPDLAPRPQTAANAEFRRRFYARWGRENAVVCGRAVHAEYEVFPQTLSVKMAAGGRERYFLARREVAVDDDNFLVLNEGSRYGSLLRAALPGGPPAWTFALFFRPGMQREVANARAQRLGAALDAPDLPQAATGNTPSSRSPTVGFAEHLRPHGGAISRRLRHIAAAVQAGERDEVWLEEQCTALLDAMLDAEAAPRPEPAARHAQRAELQRRLHLAADFIETHHAEALTLERMAEVACLSRYHFVREFARAFGLSPHAYLTRKRAHAALRCLRDGATDREALAYHCGFGSRWSLTRALARHASDAQGARDAPRA